MQKYSSPVFSLLGFALLSSIVLALLLPLSAFAADVQSIAVNQVLSDGKDGRVWRQWRQQIAERGVERVEVIVAKTSGGPDTFLNLRFGNGATFENSKQAFLPDGQRQTFTWNVAGASPGGQPLVLNAYKGEVNVSSVRVVYHKARIPTPGVPNIGNRPNYPKPPRGPNFNEGYGGGDNSPADLSIFPNPEVARSCRRGRFQQPRIEIGELRSSGGLFSGKYRVSGSVFGACVQEAGYFENGRLKEKIPFPVEDSYQRREFQIKARSGQNGELRIYSTNGDEDVVYIDQEISAQKQGYR